MHKAKLKYSERNGIKVRGGSEFKRNVDYYDDMVNLNGKFVFGSDWHLPVHFKLYDKRSVLDAMEGNSSKIAFDMNYMSIWSGSVDGALVNIDEVQSLRVADLKPVLDNKNGDKEIYIAMDIARSQKDNNNKTVFVVLEVHRNKNGNLISVDVVNIISMPNGYTFLQQTIMAKRLQKRYNAKKLIFDANGIGKGVQDFLILVNEDFETRDIFDSWRIENVPELTPEETDAKPLAFGFNASTYGSDAIVNFWDYISSGKVRFLPSARNAMANPKLKEYEQLEWQTAYMQTDYLIDELSNLRAKETGSRKWTVEQVTKKIDKDRYSALIYGLWYIQYCENNNKKGTGYDYKDLFFFD